MPLRNSLVACGLVVPIALLAVGPASAQDAPATTNSDGTIVYSAPLKVCADPNNLPYSDKTGAGFENKLADMLAEDMGTTVSYTWFPDRRGFISHTLDAGECDVVMGTPNVDGVLTTRAYYRSGYVFVTRKADKLDFSSIKSPELKQLKVGVHVIGDDAAGTPPAVVLGEEGIVDNVVGFPIYGNYAKPSPPGDIIKALADGSIDVAAVWGPIGGYFAKQSPVPMVVTPITDTTSFLPQNFQYSISMGVRSDENDLKLKLNNFISRHQSDITALLQSYGVPLL
jgi:quinoprotein dehydrogenase-associated probable ABC transporter substrate-binding protein